MKWLTPTGFYYGNLFDSHFMGYTSTGCFFSAFGAESGEEMGPEFGRGDRLGILVETTPLKDVITFYKNDERIGSVEGMMMQVKSKWNESAMLFGVAMSSPRTSVAIQPKRTRPPPQRL
jgi:hypothetical protein